MLYFIKQCIGLTRDLMKIPMPEQILKGEKMFRPFIRYQKNWARYFYPHEEFSFEYDAWFYLQKYMMPLIKQYASSYHVEGIKRLHLDSDKQPDFKSFQKLFYEVSNGFAIQPVNSEIDPMAYFTLISQRKFPCIQSMRSLSEVFCANEPDFWHEAIGHIAPLCFKEVQDFYLDIARYVLSAKSRAEYQSQVGIAWVLTEYGFLKQQGTPKMFGAALVGSHLSHMRYLKGLIRIESAGRNRILQAEMHSEKTPLARDNDGNLRFFFLDDLSVAHLFLN